MFRIFLFSFVFCFSSGVSAKTLTCTADRGEDSKGWIPNQFSLDVSEDRKVARVLRPKLEVFGAKDFEKGMFGSDLWARGKGKSKTGDQYNYQLQLMLSDNDSRYRVTIKEQGYRDLSMKGSCIAGSRVSSSS